MSSHRTRLNPDLVGCGLLAVTIGLLFWNRATFDISIARHDNLTAYLPWWGYLGQRLAAGQIPGWNSHQFSGIPFLADPQSGWMYAPAMLAFTIFDPLTGMKAKLLIELLIAGYGTYALARLYGYSPIAAFTGAALFIFGPFSHFTSYCCISRPGSRSPCSARRSHSAPGAGLVAWPGSGSAPSPTARCWPAGSGRARTMPP